MRIRNSDFCTGVVLEILPIVLTCFVLLVKNMFINMCATFVQT